MTATVKNTAVLMNESAEVDGFMVGVWDERMGV